MSEITETVKDYFTSTHFKRDQLMDKLSEFVTVERGGIKLYEAALKLVRSDFFVHLVWVQVGRGIWRTLIRAVARPGGFVGLGKGIELSVAGDEGVFGAVAILLPGEMETAEDPG